MKPMWQRARVTHGAQVGHEYLIGLEAWCIGRPWLCLTSVVGSDGEIVAREMVYSTNILYGKEQVVLPSAVIELLARSPDDFAEEVEMVSYDEWIAQSGADRSTANSRSQRRRSRRH